MDDLKRSVTSQLQALQNSIEGKRLPAPTLLMPAPTQIQFPYYVIILLGLNVFLLIVVIILIIWLREQYYVHRETHKKDHIHPAPKALINYVGHQLEHKKKLHSIRLELAKKGWTPSIIEHAIHAAKEK